MTADLDAMVAARLASIDETLRRADAVAGRCTPDHSPGVSPLGLPVPAVVTPKLETRPGAASDPLPAVLLVRWRPLIFRTDGTVELGQPRTGPARSDQMRPPVEIRLTDAMLDGLFDCLWPHWQGG